MNSISCIITEDEPTARKGLQGYIEKIDFLNLIAVCENPLELNSVLKEKNADVLFLDIEMPHMSGIDFLKSLSNPPKVIFTTAYENYALQGFELDVLDYLLKPVSFERFFKAANKAFDYYSQQDNRDQYIFIRSGNKLEKVFFDDIVFIEAMENYIGIYTTEKKIISHSTLKAIQQSTPPGFIQSHKSYLVNTKHITSIEGNIIHCNNYQIPISKYLKELVLEKILNNRLLRKG